MHNYVYIILGFIVGILFSRVFSLSLIEEIAMLSAILLVLYLLNRFVFRKHKKDD